MHVKKRGGSAQINMKPAAEFKAPSEGESMKFSFSVSSYAHKKIKPDFVLLTCAFVIFLFRLEFLRCDIIDLFEGPYNIFLKRQN
jgi:hypothetical protein